MKIKKILIGSVVVVFLLVVIALVVAGIYLDDIVKKGVETYGPQITKVSVNVDGVHIGLMTGSAKIKGLAVGNPEGYKTPHSITAGVISVGVNPGSLLSDKIVVRSIRLEAAEITFEGGLKNNLMQIKDNLGGTNQATGTEPASTGPATKLQVDDFLITGAKVYVARGGTNMLTLPVPDIHLTNLGTGPEGITATDLTKRVLDALLGSTIKVVATEATGLGKNAGETATKAAKGISDLFKKKQKDE